MGASKWFAFWSNRQPDDVSPRIKLAELRDEGMQRLVALRSAIRAFPGLASIGEGTWALGREVDLPIRLHAVRTIFVTWSELAVGGVRPDARHEALEAFAAALAPLDAALPEFYDRNIISSDYAVAAWQENVEAARRAAALVEAIGSLQFQTLPFDAGRRYRDFLDTLCFFGPDGRDNRARWRGAQRAAIGADCAVLQNDVMTLEELALAPLWPNASSAAFETDATIGKRDRNRRELGESIADWLRARKDGSPIPDRPAEAARERVVLIASLPRAFWESRPAAEAFHAFGRCLRGDPEDPAHGQQI